MKLFYLTVLIVLTICFTACDGRDRLDRTPQEVLQESKLLDSFSEQEIRFIPKEYAEKTTDTIFSNGYEVDVKMYTDMDNHITVNLVADWKIYKSEKRVGITKYLRVANKSRIKTNTIRRIAVLAGPAFRIAILPCIT